MNNDTELKEWVENYFKQIQKTSKIGDVKFSYYKSLRGYFKHSIILTDIKEKEFSLTDYKVWERILTLIKSSHNPTESGGIYLRYSKFKDLCSERSYYKTKKKFIELKLIIETPFKNYYILNPLYIIKLYNPT